MIHNRLLHMRLRKSRARAIGPAGVAGRQQRVEFYQPLCSWELVPLFRHAVA